MTEISNQCSDTIVEVTKTWLLDIVIGLNFCPFAKKEWANNTIDYCIDDARGITQAIDHLLTQCDKMATTSEIETSLMIYGSGFGNFDDYLDLLDLAQQYLVDAGFEGQFQLASFHPDYCFEGLSQRDVENYTNRSPYPMLHIIREDSMAKVLNVYKNPEKIPEDNMAITREKGADFFRQYLINNMDSNKE